MRLRGGASTRSAANEAAHGSASHCAVCNKRFHAFRHKHRCQTCSLSVCSRCVHAQRPRSPVSAHSCRSTTHGSESVEVCLPCYELEREQLKSQRIQAERRRRLQQLERKHFGPRRRRETIRRRRSCCDLKLISETVVAAASPAISVTPIATKITEPEPPQECALCEQPMLTGDAVFTTACSHNFHWRCLKTRKADARGVLKCPTCRVAMTEMQAKRVCSHSRVYPGNRFCRDCGVPFNELRFQSQSITSHSHSQWRSIEIAPAARAVGLLLLRLLDYAAFGIVRLLLATVMLIGAGIQRVVRIPWLSYVDYLVFGCVRLLFHGTLHVVYIFHRLLQPRQADRVRRLPRGGRYHNR